MTQDNEREIEEAVEDYKEKQEKGNYISKFSTTQITIGVIVVALLVYFVFLKETVDRNLGWLLGGAFIVGVYLISKQDDDEVKYITYEEAETILKKHIKDRQKMGILPAGVISIKPEFNAVRMESVLTKFRIGVELETRQGVRKSYEAQISPFGRMKAFFSVNEGLDIKGTDTHFVRRKEDIWDKKYFQK